VPPHLYEVFYEVERLLNLREGWDSYGARQIQPAAGQRALSLLVRARWDGRLPSVSPTPSGGVQLEWGGDDEGVELEFKPDGQVTVLVDVNGGMWERTVADPDDPVVLDALGWAEKLA
jgi:hypothetical protein